MLLKFAENPLRISSMSWQKNVRVGSVTVLITEIEFGSKAGSYRVQGHENGKHKVFGVYKERTKAIDKAKENALKMSRNNDILLDLDDEQKRICRAVINSDLSFDDVDRLIRRLQSVKGADLGSVVGQYIEHRQKLELSLRYRIDLENFLSRFVDQFGKDMPFAQINSEDIETWLNSLTNNKSKNKEGEKISKKRYINLRSYLSSLWKWATVRKFSHKNIIENILAPTIKARSGGHEVLTPHEYALLLHNVSAPYQPWLVISGFAGLRASEICGEPGRLEDRLRWDDFDWKNNRLVVRPETSKTSLPRIVPIAPVLLEWLKPWFKSSGFVHNTSHPTKRISSDISETKRLGLLIGGWRRNCLRASRSSYRYAETGNMHMTAAEGGHTESIMKKNYLSPRFAEDAELWYSLTPGKVREIIENKIIKLA